MSFRWYVSRSGVGLGLFSVTWLDLWTGAWGLELVWNRSEPGRVLFSVGFRDRD